MSSSPYLGFQLVAVGEDVLLRLGERLQRRLYPWRSLFDEIRGAGPHARPVVVQVELVAPADPDADVGRMVVAVVLAEDVVVVNAVQQSLWWWRWRWRIFFSCVVGEPAVVVLVATVARVADVVGVVVGNVTVTVSVLPLADDLAGALVVDVKGGDASRLRVQLALPVIIFFSAATAAAASV